MPIRPKSVSKTRVFVPRGDAAVDLLSRQADLAVLADERTVAADQDARVVNRLAVALVKARDQVEVMLPCDLAQKRVDGPGIGSASLA